MKQILILTVALLPFVTVAATYRVENYDPDYSPYNLAEAISRDLCQNEVEDFDIVYERISNDYQNALINSGGGLQSGVEAELNNAINQFETNKLFYADKFKDCIEADDEAEEAEAKKEAQERFEQQQLEKLQKAIEECDLDYLESLSDKDKMATYDERMACKEKLAEEANKTTETVIAPVQTYTPPVPVPTQPISVPIQRQEESEPQVEPEPEEIVEEEASSSEKIEVTEDELNRIIEERVSQALEEKQETPKEVEQPKQSFFKKVFNFFFGWF